MEKETRKQVSLFVHLLNPATAVGSWDRARALHSQSDFAKTVDCFAVPYSMSFADRIGPDRRSAFPGWTFATDRTRLHLVEMARRRMRWFDDIRLMRH